MKSVVIQNIHRVAPRSRSLPRGKYAGFAIGADTHHTELLVTFNGIEYYVGMGSPVVLPDPDVGTPIFAPVRFLAHQVSQTYEPGDKFNAYQSKAHLLGIECPREFEYAMPRRQRSLIHRFTPAGTADAGAVLVVPFAGRTRAHFHVGGEAGEVSIFGGTANSLGLTVDESDVAAGLDPATDAQSFEYHELHAATVHDGTETIDYIVEDLDTYDVLELRLGAGLAYAATVEYRVI